MLSGIGQLVRKKETNMDQPEFEHPDSAIDSFLRRNAPAPDPAWVIDTERRLLGHQRLGRPRIRRHPVAVGAALAGALAALVTALALAGGGPLGGIARKDARAKDTCHVVRVKREVRSPAVLQGRDGKTRIVYTTREITRDERVCR